MKKKVRMKEGVGKTVVDIAAHKLGEPSARYLSVVMGEWKNDR